MKNNKKIKNRLSFKILSLILLFMTILNVVPVFANNDIGQINILRESYDPYVLKRGAKDQGCPNVIAKKDGEFFPAYCINMERPGVGSVGIHSQVVTLQNRHIEDPVYRAVINGYPYKTIEELGVQNAKEAYYATKFAVWAMQHNLGLDYYTSNGSAKSNRIHNAYKQIITDARKDTRTFNNVAVKIEGVSKDWTVLNNRTLERKYIIQGTREGKVDLKVSGVKSAKIVDIYGRNKKTFKVGDEFYLKVDIKDLKKVNKINIEGKASMKTYPVLYGKTHDEKLQNYVYTGRIINADIQIKHEITLTNETKIKVVKLDGEINKPLEGVEFRISSKEHGYSKVFKTNAKGEIVIDKILPGKYSVKEEKTLEGYAKLEEDINIDLKFNETTTLVVRNNMISFEKNKTSQKVIGKESFRPSTKDIDYKITEEVKHEEAPTKEYRLIVNGEKRKAKKEIKKVKYKVLPKTGY